MIKAATSETRADKDGFATQAHIDFYLPIAKGGTPLIITGNIYVSFDGKSTPMQMGADDDDKIPALSRLVDAVHAHGVKIFAQLSHSGREVVPSFAGLREAVSASDVTDLSTGTRPRALTVAEIERVVERFGDAAARCKTAGFDGIEIHAGHGYLISQFLTPYTNRRTDQYGGAPENRVKLLRDVYRAIRARVGADSSRDHETERIRLPTIPGGLDHPRAGRHREDHGARRPRRGGSVGRALRVRLPGRARHVRPLSAQHGARQRAPSAGPASCPFTVFWPLFALVCNLIWRPYEGYNLRYAREFKKVLSIPVLCVGGFLTRAAMQAAIEQGLCDAISVGRGFIANPLLYQHLRDGTPGPRCVDCNACLGHIGTRPIDCYHPDVRAEKDAILAAMP